MYIIAQGPKALRCKPRQLVHSEGENPAQLIIQEHSAVILTTDSHIGMGHYIVTDALNMCGPEQCASETKCYDTLVYIMRNYY